MRLVWFCQEASALVGSKGNVWPCALLQVVQFPYDPSIVEMAIMWWHICMQLQEFAGHCWCEHAFDIGPIVV